MSESVGQQFARLRPLLEGIADELVHRIRGELLSAGIGPHTVEARVKEVHSFVVKADKKGYGNPLLDMGDKIGIRVECVSLEDVEHAVSCIRGLDGFEDVRVEDKRLELGDNTLGYDAVHVDVTPGRDHGDVEPAMARTEVQVRTMAQGLWAAATHSLGYKGVIALDSSQRRRLNRLTALMEMFDEEVERVRSELQARDDYHTVRLVSTLERLLAGLGEPPRSHRDVTMAWAQDLLSASEHGDVAEALDEWIEPNADKIQGILREYRDDPRLAAASRPEGLLAFYLFDTRLLATARRWHEHQEMARLESLAEIWGAVLPELE